MKKKAPLSAEALWDFAIKALASRAYSTGELRSKLIGRAERPADAEQTIARLRDYGYLNDSRFAENTRLRPTPKKILARTQWSDDEEKPQPARQPNP